MNHNTVEKFYIIVRSILIIGMVFAIYLYWISLQVSTDHILWGCI